MKQIVFAVAVAAAIQAIAPASTFAAVTADEAAQLKTTLTPFGAIRAGNADGSIPQWSGEAVQAPPGHKAGSVGPAPFSDEKPTVRITAANMDKYADKLSEATKLLLKTYPDFRLDVYPTHRTATAPQQVYDATFTNATHARTTKDGLAVEGAQNGIPFPIPKSGLEALWNDYLAWKGNTISTTYDMYLVPSDGHRELVTTELTTDQYDYYNADGHAEKSGSIYWQHKANTTAPARSAGEAILGVFYTDYKDREPIAWQYLPGQRRVRQIPNLNYDTPNFFLSGVSQFDEGWGFFGKPDQMDFKIIGRKEMYVPYNTNQLNIAPRDKAFGPHFPNPDMVRWELHRVWEVEAVLKPGMRNVVPKRHLFLDEDSWNILMTDEWDAQGKLFRSIVAYPFLWYDGPGVVALPFLTFDFQTRSYAITAPVQDYKPIEHKPASFFNPDSMVQDALR